MELCWSYNQVQKSSYFESLLVTRLWEIKLTSPLPSIQSCSFKFWAWSCILATLIKGGGGSQIQDHGHWVSWVKVLQCREHFCNWLWFARHHKQHFKHTTFAVPRFFVDTCHVILDPVVQKLDSAIHLLNKLGPLIYIRWCDHSN